MKNCLKFIIYLIVFDILEASVGDEKAVDSENDNSPKEGASDSEVDVKEDETTQTAEATSEQPRGLGNN